MYGILCLAKDVVAVLEAVFFPEQALSFGMKDLFTIRNSSERSMK
jgi:hypothetical protein